MVDFKLVPYSYYNFINKSLLSHNCKFKFVYFVVVFYQLITDYVIHCCHSLD